MKGPTVRSRTEAEGLERLGHLGLHHLRLVIGVALRVPELEVAAHPEQHHIAHQPGREAQFGRDQHPRRSVDLHVHRVAEKDPLPAAGLHGQTGDPVAKDLPCGARKDQQRALGVLGDRELVDTHRGQQLAMTRRHGDTPLAVQRQGCGPLKHDVCHKNPQKCTLRHFSGTNGSGQLLPERKFNGIKDLAAI
jgi:hypothetical protein